MKGEKNSPEKLKQPKITMFLLKDRNKNERKANGKRKRTEEETKSGEMSQIHKKVALGLNSENSEVLAACLENLAENSSKKELLKIETENNRGNSVDFGFEDFENDPFLSPSKDKSPRRKVLSPKNDTTQNIICSPPLEDKAKLNFEKSELRFDTPLKCRVVTSSVSSKGRIEQILVVKKENSDKKGVCKLRDVWTFSSFSVNDVVTIQAAESEDGWVVDNKSGFVILNPDIIISSTSLVSSMFCMRQGVLSSLYKGIDSRGSVKMLMGRLIHELLQECLKTHSCSDEDVSRITENFFKSRVFLRDFYLNDLKQSDIQTEINNFVPRIQNFIDVYMNKKLAPSGKNFHGSIEDILDIEELIRSPTLGIQGRIDVTVRLKSQNLERIAPLELKTGRASFSNEHKTQLILYVLLMNELGRKVESGLLLYLKEGIMEEIMPERDEIRNLFLLRNELVRFYANMKENGLPEPIRSVKACCKCPYLRVCSTYLKGEGIENHCLASIEVPDITPAHIDYFMKWNKMLWLEHGHYSNEAPDENEIGSLKLESSVENDRGEFRHYFRKTVDSGGKYLQPGSFVHLLNAKSNRIAAGTVLEITDSGCSVLLDKKIEDFSDFYKILGFKSKFLNFYLTNLGLFLEEKFEFLRQIIIDRRLPTFQEKLEKKVFMQKCLNNMLDLNKEQQTAVLKSLLCNDYLLIKGPPGTGKTQTIVTLIRTLVGLGMSVLIASHTNSSVDNILLKLENVPFLRLGFLRSVNKKIHENCYEKLIENCSDLESVNKLFERPVFASTCWGIDTDFINRKKFDFCIIDESSQVLQPEILRPLFCSTKFILVGDEDQLPPIVQNLEAKKLGMDKSMFEWLRNDSSTVSLRFQYRMNSVINSLANAIAYKGLVECANEEVAKATIKIKNLDKYIQSDEWITDVLSTDLDKSVVFVDTSGCCWADKKSPEERRTSVLEANIIVKLIRCLVEFGVDEDNVGLITPFCDQILLLKKKLAEENLKEIEINTVDQFQGRDKDVIFFSCAKENQRSRETSEGELLNDKRRLTVAVTRAKHKLVLVGDKLTMVKYESFRSLIESLSDSQFLSLANGHKNFFWDKFLV